jgi:hypothetical protein
VTQQHHGRYFAEGLIPHQRENTREQIQDALDAGEREVWHLVGVSNVLPELTESQLGRLEEELRRERQRRASSAGGGEGAPQIHEGTSLPVTEVLEYRPYEDGYLQLEPRRYVRRDGSLYSLR